MYSSSLVRKAAKARDYAEQGDRASLISCSVSFRGDNGDHLVTYEAGAWRCDCHTHMMNQDCSHAMAMELMLTGLLPE